MAGGREVGLQKGGAVMSAQKIKLCVSRNTICFADGKRYTGVFTWRGKNWINAEITGLVKELPSSISHEDLRVEYKAAVKAQRESAVQS